MLPQQRDVFLATFWRKNDVSSMLGSEFLSPAALLGSAFLLSRASLPRRAVLDSRRRTAPALSTLPAGQNSSHIDKRVGNYPESHPPFHAFLSPIPAAVEAVPSTLIRPSQPVLHFCPLRN